MLPPEEGSRLDAILETTVVWVRVVRLIQDSSGIIKLDRFAPLEYPCELTRLPCGDFLVWGARPFLVFRLCDVLWTGERTLVLGGFKARLSDAGETVNLFQG